VIYKEPYNESKINARSRKCSRRKVKTGLAESGTKSVQEEKGRRAVEGSDRRAQ
jgi:hypothetical protein